jgi:hypothetical protein
MFEPPLRYAYRKSEAPALASNAATPTTPIVNGSGRVPASVGIAIGDIKIRASGLFTLGERPNVRFVEARPTGVEHARPTPRPCSRAAPARKHDSYSDYRQPVSRAATPHIAARNGMKYYRPRFRHLPQRLLLRALVLMQLRPAFFAS